MRKNKLHLVALAAIGALSVFPLTVSAMPVSSLTETESVQEEEIIVVIDENPEEFLSLPDSDELAEGYIVKQFYDMSDISMMSTRAGDLLSGPSKNFYNLMKEKIQQVAAGETASTVFTVATTDIMGQEVFYATNLGYESIDSNNAREAASKALSYERRVVLDALANDMPYELFWFNKVQGGLQTKYSIRFTPSYVRIENIQFSMAVTSDYMGEDTFTVNQDKLLSVSIAVENAKEIVRDAEAMDDLDKLYYYRSSICELSSYNYPASSGNYPSGYGDPWQMVYVFDRNPETTVVCEGYSKAFQYLMDETAFSTDEIYSYIVTGHMGSGPHMWNIIHMDDGEQYLVDITNSYVADSNKKAQKFIAAPVRGSVDEGYYFDQTLYSNAYIYDDDTKQLFPREMLTLSSTPYKEKEAPFTVGSIKPVTAGLNGAASIHVDAEGAETYTWQYSKDEMHWYTCTYSGARTDTLNFTVTAKNASYAFRCKVTSSDGRILYTNSVGITVIPGVEISEQPQSVAAVKGDSVNFSVIATCVASGGYVWQYSKDGIHWYNSSNKGAKTNGLTVTVTENSRVNKYRCVMQGKDGNTYYSNLAAIIVMDEAPENSTASIGQKAVYTVKVNGTVSYLWEYSMNGGVTWKTTSVTGKDTNSITVNVTEKYKNNLYRCKMTTADGYTAYTKAVGIVK